MSTNVVGIKGAKEAPRGQRSSMETLLLTPEMINQWQLPPCQRPLKMNNKVKRLAQDIKDDGGVIPGTITLGRLGKSNTLYIVDGQHRLEAFKLSGWPEAIVDVRIITFDTMAELSLEYVHLNSALARMGPDDILRGLESTSPTLQRIRSECPFVGYDNVRRSTSNAAIVSMSVTLRCWLASAEETPVGHLSGRSTSDMVAEIDKESSNDLIKLLHLFSTSWGRDPEYYRLWGALNITLNMWLYRRLVLDKSRGARRFVSINDNQFRQCMMSLSADRIYLDWLPSRLMSNRDRSPCFNHLRRIIIKRLRSEGLENPKFPQPAWYRA